MKQFDLGYPTHILKRKLHFSCDLDNVIYPKGTLVKIMLFKPLPIKLSGEKIGGISFLNSKGTDWFKQYDFLPGYDLGFTKKQFEKTFKKINYCNVFNKTLNQKRQVCKKLYEYETKLDTIVVKKLKEITNESSRTD